MWLKEKIKLPDFNKYAEYPAEEPSSTHPQLSFVDVSDGTKGLMIANNGLYEYEVMDNANRSIAITLLRCIDRIYKQSTDGHYLSTCDEGQIPQAQCIGEYTFDYSIIPHQGTWENAWQKAYEFKFPLKSIIDAPIEEEALKNYKPILPKPQLLSEHAFITIESKNLVITTIKRHEHRDSLIIRLFNLTYNQVKSKLKVDIPSCRFIRAYKTTLNEERTEELIINNSGCIDLVVNKKELYTIELEKSVLVKDDDQLQQ